MKETSQKKSNPMILMLMIIILILCSEGCVVTQQERIVAVPLPQEKIMLPERTHGNEVRAIPLASQTKIIPPKAKEITVGPGGGAYLPKAALENFRYQQTLDDYYEKEVVKISRDYNDKIDARNKSIAEKAPEPKKTEKKWYWPF